MKSPGLSRRDFLKTASLATAALSLPRLVRAQTPPPSEQLTIGLIGNGLICGHHFGVLTGRDDCRIVAVCDVNLPKARTMRDRAEKHYGANAKSGRARGIDVYQHHEDLLARDDIDVVFVTTPDHWHAAIAGAAMVAGKDVYCEKPLTLTVPEGRALVNIARRYGRVLQTGTQQRSNAAFRKAAEIVRNRLIGDIKLIRTRLGTFPPALPLPEQPVPAEFDYDRWLGPTPWRPFNEKRVLGDYGGGWRCFTEYGGRKNGDWGAHHFDIIQWALGMDASGPVEFIPRGFQGTPHQTHVYADGVRVERVDEGLKAMIEFQGTRGTVWVSRDDYLETDPPELATRALRAEDQHLYVSDNHHTDFFNCVRTRQRPIADVEIGHRSATVGHLNNIAQQLARPVRWDPAREEIIGDPVASALLDRSRRAPYGALL
ncbi:Gfo/Idh/MocA family protein [Opitutus terrae]|uniref:Oxidoreductase domain protein n=1 Tax=Opitutus terrae (strain DSM 11246 / JCM 15787 / PB90-1) TaxID=452637 RepID=B1ZVB7_OPITP|nr:Gfo/Idh/MocA family oxidoreductase [Opitutus terrae]ACB76784.1 oxidoreductase domain protein [Opitutus terrae PB90-1]